MATSEPLSGASMVRASLPAGDGDGCLVGQAASSAAIKSFLLCDARGEVQAKEPGMFVLCVGCGSKPTSSL